MRIWIYTALFAGLTAVCGLIRIPFFPVPMTMQTLAVFLSGYFLGKKHGTISQVVFLFTGLAGLPVFSHGGGLGYVIQPGFGYLLAFPASAFCIGLISQMNRETSWHVLVAVFLAGAFIILLVGSLYMFFLMTLILYKPMSLWKVIVSGFLIFIPGELIKSLLASWIVKRSYNYLKPWIVILFLGFVFYVPVSQSQEQDLEQIRREIAQLETDIKVKTDREKSLLEQLENIDQQIALRRKLIEELKVQRKKNERSIRTTRKQLEETTEEFERLKTIIKKRLVAMYKRGKISNLEIFLNAGSFNRMLIWMKYQQRIVENDQRNLRLFKEKRDQILRQQHKLKNELAEKQALIAEKKEEVEITNKQKTSRSELLDMVQKDKKLLSKQLERKRWAYAQIARQIQKEEEQRRQSAATEISTNFASLKGSLDWPVPGAVVARYGRYKNADLNIYSENQGIDIMARPFENVQAVCKGMVSMKTWLPVFGNTIILDHGDGYYTVYSRLQNVFVKSGDIVEKGMFVGEVGDNQSMNQTLLQFQVWKGQNHIDPLGWLKKG